MLSTENLRVNHLSLLLLAVFLLGIVPALVVREQWLWMDEVLSYLLISDISPVHLNDAVVSNMDANPPLFPNLFWLIGHTISLNPVFLRAISALLFVVALVLFYGYTLRLVGNPTLNFVLISAMAFFTHQNFAHATEIRSYALLLPISLIYFFVMHALIDQPANRRLLALHTLLALLMAFCHNYALFYLTASGAFFGLLWLWSRDNRYTLAMASLVIVGLAWLLLWYPSFRIQSYAGQPHSWIPLPTVSSTVETIGDLIPNPFGQLEFNPQYSWLITGRVVLFLSLFLYIAIPRLRPGFAGIRQDRAFQFFLLSGFVCLTTLLISLIVSLTYTSVFISRYMWPSHLLAVYVLLYSFYQLVDGQRLTPVLSRALPLYALLLISGVFYKVWKIRSPFRSQLLTYLPQLDARYPVFVERADYFLPIWFHNQHHGIAFLLDWNIANQPGNILSATTDYKILKSVRDKYAVDDIVPLNRFNAHNFPHFYVVDEAAIFQIEHFIDTHQISVVRELPIDMVGHRILECTFRDSTDSMLSANASLHQLIREQQTN